MRKPQTPEPDPTREQPLSQGWHARTRADKAMGSRAAWFAKRRAELQAQVRELMLNEAAQG